MGLLEKLRLTKRRARPVGKSLEKGRGPQRKGLRTHWAVKIGILVLLVVATVAAFTRNDIYNYTVEVGTIWRQAAVEAPFDFPIYKSEETMAEERDQLLYRTPPYFREVDDASAHITANRDTVAQQLDAIFDAYASYKLHRMRNRPEDAARDSARYMDLRRNAWLKASPEQWNLLVSDYTDRIPGLPTSSRQPRNDRRLDRVLLEQAWRIANELTNVGVMDVPLDSIRTDQIIVRDERERVEQVQNKVNLYGLNEAFVTAQDRLQQQYPGQPDLVNLGTSFFRIIFVPSLRYMRAETMRELQRKERRISPVRGKVNEGETIVEEGQVITDEIKRKLTSLERVQRERSGERFLWGVALGQTLVTVLAFLMFFLYLFFLRRSIFDDNSRVLLIALIFGAIVGLFAVAIRIPEHWMYAVPVAIAPILLTVIFDSRVGLFGALTLAVIGGLLLNYDFEFTFATYVATTLGVFSVRDIKNRGQFFLIPAVVLPGYLLVIGATAILYSLPQPAFLANLLRVGINAVLLLMAYPLLWVFERAFDVTTDLTLLELSDTNRPVLKELSLRAPGTFNHSLQVANLAEAAADAIGANALLTRVGALYHDIGKMLKPEYFVENQRPSDNPHDQLKPRMSALIIASHVKEGIDMGERYNLPQRVLDFVPMHHGTTRIEYFFRRAIEQQHGNDANLLESEFRYPGPRPSSKETGILMLADSVEAASRSLTDPTHKRLETLIDMIFKARIEDGQLDRTDLTFRELTQIKETFLNMLLGIYHVRVKYPGQEREEEGSAEGAKTGGTGEREKGGASGREKGGMGDGERSGEGGSRKVGEAGVEEKGPSAEGHDESDDEASSNGSTASGEGDPETRAGDAPPPDDGEEQASEPDQKDERSADGRSAVIGDPERRAAGNGGGEAPTAAGDDEGEGKRE